MHHPTWKECTIPPEKNAPPPLERMHHPPEKQYSKYSSGTDNELVSCIMRLWKKSPVSHNSYLHNNQSAWFQGRRRKYPSFFNLKVETEGKLCWKGTPLMELFPLISYVRTVQCSIFQIKIQNMKIVEVNSFITSLYIWHCIYNYMSRWILILSK